MLFPEINVPVYAIRDNGFEQWYKLTKRHGIIARNSNHSNGLTIVFCRFHGRNLSPIGIGEAWEYNLPAAVVEDIKLESFENIVNNAIHRFSRFVHDGKKQFNGLR